MKESATTSTRSRLSSCAGSSGLITFRLPADDGTLGLAPTPEEGGVLFAEHLTFVELGRRFDAGTRIVEVPADGAPGAEPQGEGLTPLFVLTLDGGLRIVSTGAARGKDRRDDHLPCRRASGSRSV